MDRRRVCVVAGTQTYGAGFEELIHVPKELSLIRTVLSEACGMEVAPGVDLNPDPEKFLDAVKQAMAGRPEQGVPPPYSLVVYYSGHGFLSGVDFRLATALSSVGDPTTGFSAHALMALVHGEGPQEVMVMLDACFSGEAGDAFHELRNRKEQQRASGPSVYLLASASRVEPAKQMLFADACAAALLTPGVSNDDRYIPPMKLLVEINARMKKNGQRAYLFSPEQSEECQVFPNPRNARRNLVQVAEATQGTGWMFCGRQRAIEELVTYLRGSDPNDPPYLVTGSGKSTLLGWTQAASAGRPLPTTDADAVLRVPPNCVDVFVDAKGSETYGVLSLIAKAFDIRAKIDSPEFFQELESRPGSKRILIDSVHQANDQMEMLTEVLVPLARLPSVRLVMAADTALGGLAAREIALDGPDHFDPADIRQVARSILTLRDGSLHRDAPAGKLDRMSALVSERAGTSFLWAYLFAIDLAARQPEEVEADVRASVADIFESQLARLTPSDPTWAADLLMPLAFAFGAGMPNYRIWIDVVGRLSGRQIDRNDLDRLISATKEFVSESLSDPDTTGWRLHSAEFGSFLGRHQNAEAAHTAFAEALLAALPMDDRHRPLWSGADRYTRLNLAEHALRAERLDRYLDDPGFLLTMDKRRLRRALTLDGRTQARAVWDLCELVHGRRLSDDHDLSRLSFLAAAHGLTRLAERARQRSDGWRSAWSDRTPSDAVSVVHGDRNGYVVVTTQAGTALLADAGRNNWRNLMSDDDPVSALDTGLLNGHPHAVIGQLSGTVTLHNLSTGQSSELEGFNDRIVSCVLSNRGLLVATYHSWRHYEVGVGVGPEVDSGGLVLSAVTPATVGGTRLTIGTCANKVAVWDAHGVLQRTFRTRQRKALTAVTVFNGEILTASDDGTVCRSDLQGHHSQLLVQHSDQPVTSMRLLQSPGEPLLLTASLDGSVSVSPLTGQGAQGALTVDVGLQIKAADLEGAGRLVLCSNMGTVRLSL